MVPRKRSIENKWLEHYPGLHVFQDGRFYVIHPTTKKSASLGTRDKQTALALYARLKARWEPELIDAAATAMMARMDSMETPRSEGDHISFRDYAKAWREDILGFRVDAAGVVTILPTKVTMKNGKPIEPRTQRDYGRQCRQLELAKGSDFALSSRDLLRRTRKLLAQWADSPTHYNHLLAVASHIYKAAILQGVITVNPVREIEKMGTRKREVYIPDAHYVAITLQLLRHEHAGKVEDGEWRARITDLLYMLSSRPVDAFKIKDSNLRLDLGKHGEIHFGHGKTGVDQVIEMNAEMRELVEWFLAFKRQYRIFNKTALICYPPYMGQHAGKPVTHRAMWQYFHDAVIAAGFQKGQYRLADLRKKALTDEFVNQGENDKGGHKGQAMKDYYRLITPPKRSRNTLVDLRKAGTK